MIKREPCGCIYQQMMPLLVLCHTRFQSAYCCLPPVLCAMLCVLEVGRLSCVPQRTASEECMPSLLCPVCVCMMKLRRAVHLSQAMQISCSPSPTSCTHIHSESESACLLSLVLCSSCVHMWLRLRCCGCAGWDQSKGIDVLDVWSIGESAVWSASINM